MVAPAKSSQPKQGIDPRLREFLDELAELLAARWVREHAPTEKRESKK